MSFEIWRAIPAVNEGDLRPILTTVSDFVLKQQIASDLGLTDEDTLFGFMTTRIRTFEAGRFAVVKSLRPQAMQARIEANLNEAVDSRWFEVAGFALRLTEQESQGCYGGWHKGFALSVFGQ